MAALPNLFQSFSHVTPSAFLSTTPKQSKYFTELISSPPVQVSTNSESDDQAATVVDSQFRLHWERARALSLGICDFVASEINGMRMYSVTRLARIYGSENSNAFAKQWTAIKSDFQNCSEFRVFQRRGEDYITRETFDLAVLPFLKDSCADRLYTDFKESQKSQANVEVISSQHLSSSTFPVPSTSHDQNHYTIHTSALLSRPTWEITREIWTRHEGILSQMRSLRGCYIGQISQREYKFGYTDKGFMTRTDKHTKDFKDFYLCFAKYCVNGYEAERLFKSDPYVKAHLIHVKTQKQNHREIVRINSMLTEQRMREIYSKCIKTVNEQELQNLLAATKEEDVPDTEIPISPLESENSHNEMHQEIENEQIEISSTTSGSIESDSEAVDERPDAIQLRNLDLQILQENHRHEIHLRLLEQQNWLAYLSAQCSSVKPNSTTDEAVISSKENKNKHQVVEVCVPLSPSIHTKRKSPRLKNSSRNIIKIKAQTHCIKGRFSSIEEAVQSGSSYNFQKLQMAIKKGTIYKGYRWKIE